MTGIAHIASVYQILSQHQILSQQKRNQSIQIIESQQDDFQKNPSQEQKIASHALARVEDNGDLKLTPTRSFVYVSIDALGVIRQICQIARPAIAVISAPFTLIPAGVMYVYSGIFWTVPDAQAAHEASKKRVEVAQSFKNPASETAKRSELIDLLGVINQKLFIAMGLGQLLLGAFLLFTKEALQTFGPQAIQLAVLGAKALFKCIQVIAGMLGVIYIIRGIVQTGRAILMYYRLCQFRNELKNVHNNNIMDLIHAKQKEFFGEEGDTTFDPTHLAFLKDFLVERVGQEVAFQLMDKVIAECNWGKQIEGMTSAQKTESLGKDFDEHIQQSKTNSTGRKELTSDDINQAIFTEKYKAAVSMFIGVSMVIGGILSVLVAVGTSGLSAATIALVNAVFMFCVDGPFITSDSPMLFNFFRDMFYSSLGSKEEIKLQRTPIPTTNAS